MYWDMQEIDKQIFLGIKDLKVGEISNPLYMETINGDHAYRLLNLQLQTEPHKANLKDDYQMIQTYALSAKQIEIVSEWVNKKVNTTYIKIDDDYSNCQFNYNWK